MVGISKNMNEHVSSLGLGNLNMCERIPDDYVVLLLNYVIQVVAALRHAHEHDLVHGNFDLSKVLVQKIDVIAGSAAAAKDEESVRLESAVQKRRKVLLRQSSVLDASQRQASFAKFS
jgi:hypothetical protein